MKTVELSIHKEAHRRTKRDCKKRNILFTTYIIDGIEKYIGEAEVIFNNYYKELKKELVRI